MRQRFVFKAIALLAFLWVGTLSAFALDEVTYRALIEKDRIKFGEKVQYLVIVNYGTTTMAPAITPPSFAQFNVLNENQRVQEVGQGSERYRVLKRVWLLEPAETGRLSIASAIITYQDPTSNLLKNGKTDVVFVEVEPTEQYKAEEKKQADTTGNTTVPAAQAIPWGIIVLAAAGVLIGLVVWLSMRKPPSAKIVPEDTALQALQTAIDYAEAGDLDKYYAAISRVLLDYLQIKFNLDAHVLNTTVLLEKLILLGVSQANIDALREFFKIADKAKFAGYVPDEDKMIELHGIVNNFIEAGRKIKIKLPPKPKKKKDED